MRNCLVNISPIMRKSEGVLLFNLRVKEWRHMHKKVPAQPITIQNTRQPCILLKTIQNNNTAIQ